MNVGRVARCSAIFGEIFGNGTRERGDNFPVSSLFRFLVQRSREGAEIDPVDEPATRAAGVNTSSALETSGLKN